MADVDGKAVRSWIRQTMQGATAEALHIHCHACDCTEDVTLYLQPGEDGWTLGAEVGSAAFRVWHEPVVTEEVAARVFHGLLARTGWSTDLTQS